MPSNPANLSSAGQKPPAADSPTSPLSGDLAVAATRDSPEIGAPVTALTIKLSVFSGPNGAVPGGVCLRR